MSVILFHPVSLRPSRPPPPPPETSAYAMSIFLTPFESSLGSSWQTAGSDNSLSTGSYANHHSTKHTYVLFFVITWFKDIQTQVKQQPALNQMWAGVHNNTLPRICQSGSSKPGVHNNTLPRICQSGSSKPGVHNNTLPRICQSGSSKPGVHNNTLPRICQSGSSKPGQKMYYGRSLLAHRRLSYD